MGVISNIRSWLSGFLNRAFGATPSMSSRSPRIEDIFDLGDSGGSDIGAHKDEYVGEAVSSQYPHLVRTGVPSSDNSV